MARVFRAASEVGWKEKLAQLDFGGGDGAEEGRRSGMMGRRDGVGFSEHGLSRKGMISRRG